MNLKFEADEVMLEIDLDYENECHSIAVWNDDHWNIITLDNAQLDKLKQFLKIN